MRRVSFIFYFTLFLLLPFIVKGNPQITSYSLADGLSQTTITDLCLDNKGFLWIGTNDGLNRYDGYEFKVFYHDPKDRNSISNNHILSIQQDKEDNIWLATAGGLNLFNYRTGRFSKVKLSHPDYPGEAIPQKILLDRSNNTILCIARDFIARIKSNGEPALFMRIQQSDNADILFTTPTIRKHPYRNEFFLSNGSDIYKLDTSNVLSKIYLEFDKEKHVIHSFYVDFASSLWIATEGIFYRFNSKNGKVEKKLYTSKEHSGDSYIIRSIYKRNDGVFILGTNRGIKLYDPNNISKPHNPVYPEGMSVPLREATVSNIIKDESNNYWFGSSNGLFKYINRKNPFHNYSKDNLPGLPNDCITALYKTDDHVWAGNQNAGLSIIDLGTNRVKRFYKEHANPAFRLEDNRVNIIYESGKGEQFLGMSDACAVFDKREHRFVPLHEKYAEISAGLFDGVQIFAMCEGENERIWFGTSNGLVCWNRMDKSVGHYFTRNDSLSLQVFSLNEGNDNMLWLGTNRGLIRTNSINHKYIALTGIDLYDQDPGLNIYSVYFDQAENKVWAGTENGLYRYDPESDDHLLFDEDHGMANAFIHAIVDDGMNSLWVSSNHGLIRFNKNTLSVRNFDVKDGLLNYEYKHNASCRSGDGRILFGGIYGFSIFYPDSIQTNRHIPNVEITKLQMIKDSEVVDVYIGNRDTLIIPHTNNYLNIFFSALDFTLPERNQYRYSLQKTGEKFEWKYLGYKHNVVFAGLEPGNYRFHVIASNSDHVWNTTGRSLVIVVESPFWETRRARIIFLFIVITSIFLIYKFRTRTLRKLNQQYKGREIVAEKVARQKEELTLKNKNITDSINYAKRIQIAMMPSMKLFKSMFKESFILHLPKDIVSGDFYWVNEVEDKIFLAAVDCTGHGVPGAFMSIIGFELFRRITIIEKITEPAEILNNLNEDFEKIFGDVDSIILRDGMDVAFCAIDKKNKLIEFAGAFNSLYLIRDNTITEVKGDRFSIGLNDTDFGVQSFTNHVIPVRHGDVVYLFTDGYADQFGGPEGKKYKYRRFRHLLLAIHQLPMDRQHDFLLRSIMEWKSDEEQIDDILVMGIKLEFD